MIAETSVPVKADLATDLRATSKALYSEASHDWDEREEVIPWLRMLARQASDAADEIERLRKVAAMDDLCGHPEQEAEIERLEQAVYDMQLAYNNCAYNADGLRDQRDELRRENERLRVLVRTHMRAAGYSEGVIRRDLEAALSGKVKTHPPTSEPQTA